MSKARIQKTFEGILWLNLIQLWLEIFFWVNPIFIYISSEKYIEPERFTRC